MSTRLEQRRRSKTASYAIRGPVAGEIAGTIFDTLGAAGAVVFTLPALQNDQDGFWYEFQNLVNQSLTVTAPVAGGAIAFNNAAATSLSIATANQEVGAGIKATWNAGAGQWVLEGTTNGVTYTVA